MKIYTKETLVKALLEIRAQGWIASNRPKNHGAVGNTLEDLLGIEENNLPMPNAAEWELKAQRINTSSLTTLFHMEPSPTALKFVSKILLPLYGWKHAKANADYPENEMSFRQTINASTRSDRGFCVQLDRQERKITISFDADKVASHHSLWLESVKDRIGLGELYPQPYWGFDDLFHKVATKLHNCFFILAKSKLENNQEYFHYTNILMLKELSQEKFIQMIEKGKVYIDFDARTGHNHGTKFRLPKNIVPELYEEIKEL